MMVRIRVTVLLALVPFSLLSAQVDDSAFARGVQSYVTLHRAAAAGLPSGSADPTVAESARVTLARRIQERRGHAPAGSLFGEDAGRLRALVRETLNGPNGNRMLLTIEESNVHGARVRVNHRYPPALPRVTMPTQVLQRLPSLPEELEYRFLGRSLLLVDTRAGLVVDMVPDVLPARGASRIAQP